MRRSLPGTLGLLLALLLLAGTCTGSSSDRDSFKVVFFGEPDPRRESFLDGARVAEAELAGRLPGARGIEVVDAGRPGAVGLASLIEDHEVVGVVTAGAAEAIAEAAEALDRFLLPVIEVADDPYEIAGLRNSVFQAAAPHSWQALRLARYFGADDRGYSRVGLARRPGRAGDAVAASLASSLAARGVEFVDAPGGPEAALAALKEAAVEAVVVEGTSSFIEGVVEQLVGGERAYAGRSRIHDGWRPQIAGFESLLALRLTMPPGTVASADYARPFPDGLRIPEVGRFARAFSEQRGRPPGAGEALGYESVMLLGEALRRAGSAERAKVLSELESLREVRFARLEVTLGPDDHLIPERDALGLWAVSGSPPVWTHLMRTFTADTERTGMLGVDWEVYFEDTDPRGEPPSYRRATSGIITGPEDDLH